MKYPIDSIVKTKRYGYCLILDVTKSKGEYYYVATICNTGISYPITMTVFFQDEDVIVEPGEHVEQAKKEYMVLQSIKRSAEEQYVKFYIKDSFSNCRAATKFFNKIKKEGSASGRYLQMTRIEIKYKNDDNDLVGSEIIKSFEHQFHNSFCC